MVVLVQIKDSVSLRESLQNRQKSSNLNNVDVSKIARFCGLQKSPFFESAHFLSEQKPLKILVVLFCRVDFKKLPLNRLCFHLKHQQMSLFNYSIVVQSE